MKLQHLLIFTILIFLAACSGFEKIGSDLGKGVSSTSGDIGHNLVDGALKRLDSSAESQHLKHLLDSMITNAGLSANAQVVHLRDSLLNDETTERLNHLISEVVESAVGDSTKHKLASLRDELLGAKLRMQIAALRNDLLGYQTNQQIQSIARNAMAALLNDSVSIRLGVVRDTLLGSKTNNLLKAIIDTAMLGISQRLRDDLNPQIRDNLTFIKKYATELLLTLGAIAAAIIILVWRNRQKYLKAVTLLTANIQKIPNQDIYDELTAKIKNDAVKNGIEPTLRTVLKENGLLGTESWQKTKKA